MSDQVDLRRIGVGAVMFGILTSSGLALTARHWRGQSAPAPAYR
jgi:hypothetical protein